MTNEAATHIRLDPRWDRIVARERSADEAFWYSVKTTGVFCRPSCPSRLARPENVRLHDTIEDARASGARPCRRCNPEGLSESEVNIARVEQACRINAASPRPPTLIELASACELSPGRFHHVFKAVTGLTPHAYTKAHRAQTAREALLITASVTAGVHASCFGATSRFYDDAPGMFGMAPARYRDGGDGERLRFAVGACGLGEVLVASSDVGVVAILLGDEPDALVRELQDRFSKAELVGPDADYEAVVAQVVALVDCGEALDLRLDIRGTIFQQRVWEAL